MVILVSTNTLWLGSGWFRLVYFFDWSFSSHFLFMMLSYIHIHSYTLKWLKAKNLVYHEMANHGCTLWCRLYRDKNTTWFLTSPVFIFGARGTPVILWSVYTVQSGSQKKHCIFWSQHRILLTLLGLILDYRVYCSRGKKWFCCVLYLINCSKKLSQASFIFASQFLFPF